MRQRNAQATSAGPPAARRHLRLASGAGACAAAAAMALAVGLFYLWEVRGSVALTILVGDASAYHEWALRIVGGDWVGTETSYQAPLYPHFPDAVHASFGPSLWAVRLVQACIGAASCGLLAGAGTCPCHRRGALAAGLLLALYPAAVFSDREAESRRYAEMASRLAQARGAR